MTAITIVGNITRDPEVRFTPAGLAVASFGVAVGRRKKVDDRWVDDGASFYDVACWRDLGEHVAESLEKGARVVVTGRLEQRNWKGQDGSERTAWQLTADDVGASMRWATVTVAKTERRKGTDEQQPAFVPSEEPF